MRLIIVLCTLFVLGRCHDNFEEIELDEIEREDRSENAEMTEDYETLAKRTTFDDLQLEEKKLRQEYRKKLIACGVSNNFVPFENCANCKLDCEELGTCIYASCGKISRNDRNFIKSQKCDLTVDNSKVKTLWAVLNSRKNSRPKVKVHVQRFKPSQRHLKRHRR